MRNEDKIIGLQNKLNISFSYISGNSEFMIINANYRIDYHSQSSWHAFLITKYDRAFEKSKDDWSLEYTEKKSLTNEDSFLLNIKKISKKNKKRYKKN